MAEHGCPTCFLRAKYDQAPKSMLGRLWRWHIGWCPGWKSYVESLSEEERLAIEQQYGLAK
jgi:hypothetical protein